MQDGAFRTAVDVLVRIVSEVRRTEEFRLVLPIAQGHIRFDSQGIERRDILDGAVLGVGDQAFGMQLPPEEHPAWRSEDMKNCSRLRQYGGGIARAASGN